VTTTHFDREATAEQVALANDITGRVAIVTGASSGIGVDTARALAIAGADVILAVRDVPSGESVARAIAPLARGELEVRHLDLRDLDSVAAFASGVSGPVDLLIANAGVSNTPDSHLPNGLEVRFATNHLGHFVLAELLHDRMIGREARIVVVSSAAHKGNPVHLDDLQWKAREHSWGLAYSESKSANILFAQEATRRWGGEGITSNAILPGSALTGLQRYHGEELKRAIGFTDEDGRPNPMLKTVAQAAATTVWAATASELEGRGGLVLEDCDEAVPAGPDVHAWSGFDASVADPATASRLWERTSEIVEESRARSV
jgi:NAD(P)-dependent dehydrogenase (short-subunit alcohol dehydrogenase family)